MYSVFLETVSEKFVLNGLNVKAVKATFNQEKALVGAFSVIATHHVDLSFKLYYVGGR